MNEFVALILLFSLLVTQIDASYVHDGVVDIGEEAAVEVQVLKAAVSKRNGRASSACADQ